MLRIDFITLFPEMVMQAVGHSILRRAADGGLVALSALNPRDFTVDNHRTVDDNPYGGGPGMVMLAEPIAHAIDATNPVKDSAIVFLDPAGDRFTQEIAADFASKAHVILVCGHYEGIDERICRARATNRISIGDYVLTGGELPALLIADAVVRLVPGVLGCASSLEIDSHSGGLLSSPQFTRPATWRGEPIPEVLASGDHKAIERWHRRIALRTTRERRPDLFWRAPLSAQDLDLLD